LTALWRVHSHKDRGTLSTSDSEIKQRLYRHLEGIMIMIINEIRHHGRRGERLSVVCDQPIIGIQEMLSAHGTPKEVLDEIPHGLHGIMGASGAKIALD